MHETPDSPDPLDPQDPSSSPGEAGAFGEGEEEILFFEGTPEGGRRIEDEVDEVIALDEAGGEPLEGGEGEAPPGDPQVFVEEIESDLPVLPGQARMAVLDPRLVVYHDPLGPISEQYRSFRANLVSLNPSRSSKAILLTSTLREEGKSLSVLNLALCLRELKRMRVCVVDADLRRPSLHRLVGLDREMGLSDLLLEDHLSLGAVVKDVGVPNLSIITAGRLVANPAEVLASERFATLLDLMKREFNMILIDSPPSLVAADAGLCAGKCDGVVLVVRLDDTPKRFVSRTTESIRQAGGQVLGCFLTGSRPGKDSAKLYAYGVDHLPGR